MAREFVKMNYIIMEVLFKYGMEFGADYDYEELLQLIKQ